MSFLRGLVLYKATIITVGILNDMSDMERAFSKNYTSCLSSRISEEFSLENSDKFLLIHRKLCLILSRRVTHYCVVDLNFLHHYCVCSIEETFLQEFLVILKRHEQTIIFVVIKIPRLKRVNDINSHLIGRCKLYEKTLIQCKELKRILKWPQLCEKSRKDLYSDKSAALDKWIYEKTAEKIPL